MVLFDVLLELLLRTETFIGQFLQERTSTTSNVPTDIPGHSQSLRMLKRRSISCRWRGATPRRYREAILGRILQADQEHTPNAATLGASSDCRTRCRPNAEDDRDQGHVDPWELQDVCMSIKSQTCERDTYPASLFCECIRWRPGSTTCAGSSSSEYANRDRSKALSIDDKLNVIVKEDEKINDSARA